MIPKQKTIAEMLLQKLVNISVYIEKCRSHISYDTLAAFEMIYNHLADNQPLIFSKSLTVEFVEIVWNIVSDADGQFLVFEDDVIPDDEMSNELIIIGELNN